MISTIAWVAIVASNGAVGCANVSHMVLYQNTNLGLKGSVSPSTGNTSIKVGFERDFLTILPKVKIADQKGAQTDEAGTVFSSSRVSVQGLQVPDVEELILTGDAADSYAGTPDAQKAFKSDNANSGQ